ncbi:MAG: hypothetical protein NZ911_07155 [Sulfolobales archaeon]|nr:hypothetical protein [Sulfolobales archaeon]
MLMIAQMHITSAQQTCENVYINQTSSRTLQFVLLDNRSTSVLLYYNDILLDSFTLNAVNKTYTFSNFRNESILAKIYIDNSIIRECVYTKPAVFLTPPSTPNNILSIDNVMQFFSNSYGFLAYLFVLTVPLSLWLRTKDVRIITASLIVIGMLAVVYQAPTWFVLLTVTLVGAAIAIIIYELIYK